MDTRRRPTKLGLILSLLLAVASAQANVRLQIQPGHDSLRFAVPDALYAAGVSADFSGLRIQGADGRDIGFAVCPVRQRQRQRLDVPILAIPDLGRPQLNPDGSPDVSRAAGAGPATEVTAWILDLRQARGNLQQLRGMPPIRSLKLSPDLQQWSGEISFQQTADVVSIPPRPAKFVRLEPAQDTAWDKPAPQIEFVGEASSGLRQPHWFDPDKKADGSFVNPRTLPIIAAQLTQTGPTQGWTLQSRQGRWDVWKPRATFVAGERKPFVRFSAVTDPQWRVLDVEQAALQLAHGAHDIRIPQLAADASVQMIFEPGKRNGPNLSCRGTQRLPAQEPAQIRTLDNAQEQPQTAPSNLRSVFLIALAIILSVAYLVRRYLLTRRAG